MSLKQYEDWYWGMFGVAMAVVALLCVIWGVVVTVGYCNKIFPF